MSREGNPDNLRLILKERPGADKEPSTSNFSCEACPLPSDPQDGEITVQTLYLSLDPAMRCRMNDDTGVHYMAAWKIDETVSGLGGVGLVIKSRNSGYDEGDLIQSIMNWPWIQCFNTRTDSELFPIYKIDPGLRRNPQLVLSLLGMTGLTAYLGTKERGHITPGSNQTVVVSAAAGACGNLAGQMQEASGGHLNKLLLNSGIAKLIGAGKVIGICGSDNKCDYLTSNLGFDAAINYKTSNISDKLKDLAPTGVHVYFDNVGGETSEIVIKQMTNDSHVILCGQIAVYNKDLPYPPPISEELQKVINSRNITRERFLVINFQEKFEDGLKQLQQWYMEGKLKVPEFIHEGLESTPEAFVNMMTSRNQTKVGKQLIKVS